MSVCGSQKAKIQELASCDIVSFASLSVSSPSLSSGSTSSGGFVPR